METFSRWIPLQVKAEDASRIESFYGVAVLVSFHDPAVIFEQIALVYALPRMRARNMRVILPWFCTGTMERVETRGQIATAATLARMLSNIPMGPTGPVTVVVFDIHALQEQFYFGDGVLIELKSAVKLLSRHLEKLKEENPDEGIAIAFPDDGAHKRFKSKFSGYEMIICNKVRGAGTERKVVVKEGSAEGKHCVIVDDLVQSGGTLLQCAKPLKEMGATKVSCFVTHGIFPKTADEDGVVTPSFEKFFPANTKKNDFPEIHKFWVTDSVPSTIKKLEGHEPFEVLSLASLIGDYLNGSTED